MDNKQAKSIQLSKKTMLIAIIVVLALVIVAYVLTFVLPKGEYQRDDEGSLIQGTYQENPELDGIKWWQFLLSPVMILSPTSEGYLTVYVIIALLIVIGAIFNSLDESGILTYMVKSISHRFKNRKYVLLFVMSFVFMFLGSAVGMFEELIPLVPIVVLLSYAMGWDTFVGLGISVLASCFGFASGVVNPFSVGIAQTLGGIEMFSGIELRLLVFALSYLLLVGVIYPYAKRIEKYPQKSSVYKEDLLRKEEFGFQVDDFKPEPAKSKALIWFGAWMMLIVLLAIISIFVHALSDYIMYITVIVYVISGIGACIMCGLKGKKLLKCLGKGALSLMPAIVMILLAGGIRYIISEGDVLDTIMYMCTNAMPQNKNLAVLLIYAIIFLFEIFIPSGSAKAFLIMPIIFDICAVSGIDGQVAVLAFTFADGFSNMILPTNAGLLLILGMTTVSYPKWLKWLVPIILGLLIITIGVLLLALNVIYV